MLIGPKGVEFLTRISAKLIYGTILLGAVLGSLSDPLPRNLRVIIIVVVSLYAINLANAYASSINEDMKTRRSMDLAGQSWSLLRPSWLMGSVVVPVAFFGAAALGLISQQAALDATRYALVVILLFMGFVSRRVCGGGIPRSLLSGVIVATLGYVVVQLKLWSKYLPTFGL